MKVGIITFHFVNNYGGVLQAYALQKAVSEQFGVDTELIDYRNWFIRLTDTIRLFPITINLPEFFSGIKTTGQRFSRRKKFGYFTKAYCKVSGKYQRYGQLVKYPPRDDKYICGSDQIWNPVLTAGVSPAYFLKFVSDTDLKIAYAPSFGTENVRKVFTKKITANLKSIKHISVREKKGQELIYNLTGIKADRLIDPTFLLEKEQWDSIGVNPRKKDDPFILLYIMQKDTKIYELAKKIKEEMDIRLVEISRYGYNPGFVDETLVSIGPDEFIGLFRDADYVITNSYHGLAYSIIFEKEFCLIPSKRFTARINNLAELLQIKSGNEDITSHSLTADYDRDYVKNIISSEREKAFKYLKNSLGCRT